MRTRLRLGALTLLSSVLTAVLALAASVVVQNEQTVVIGGMIGQDSSNGEYKVPGLGDILILGWLFKSWGKAEKKTNLFIFITPHILQSTKEAENGLIE